MTVGVVHETKIRVLRVGGLVRFQPYCACGWIGGNWSDRLAAFGERDNHEFEAGRAS